MMPEQSELSTTQHIDEPVVAWAPGGILEICPACDWQFLRLDGNEGEPCPHCFRAKLTTLEVESARSAQITAAAPELALPFEVSETVIDQTLARFAEGIPYPPADLSPARLRQRARRIYLPTWLVDCQVTAEWQAETGYNYQVVSHQERYSDSRGGWDSRQVEENRVRWEPRLGRLAREYPNTQAPALEEEANLRRRLGEYDMKRAQAVTATLPTAILVRLPARSQQDAWSEAALVVQGRAAEEVRLACRADHIRGFRWSPKYSEERWTLLLKPVLSTYYLDDDKHPQRVLLNGQTGKLSGQRRASMQRAQSTALNLILVAGLVFFLGLICGAASLIFPPLVILAGVVLVAALGLAVGAIAPIFRVWQFNRQHPVETNA